MENVCFVNISTKINPKRVKAKTKMNSLCLFKALGSAFQKSLESWLLFPQLTF